MDIETFKAFVRHSAERDDVPGDYVAVKMAAMKMFPKLAAGLDSHAQLAQSVYHNNGANALGHLAQANPAHRGGLLGAVKKLAPAVGGVRSSGTNPLRAAASGVIHTKLANLGVAGAELAGLGVLARPSVKDLRNPAMDQTHKSHAKYELAGLGILGAHPAYEIGSHFAGKLRPLTAQATHIIR